MGIMMGSQDKYTKKIHPTEMRMLIWVRGKTNRRTMHTKNEDITGEKPTSNQLPPSSERNNLDGMAMHVLRYREGRIPPRRC